MLSDETALQGSRQACGRLMLAKQPSCSSRLAQQVNCAQAQQVTKSLGSGPCCVTCRQGQHAIADAALIQVHQGKPGKSVLQPVRGSSHGLSERRAHEQQGSHSSTCPQQNSCAE